MASQPQCRNSVCKLRDERTVVANGIPRIPRLGCSAANEGGLPNNLANFIPKMVESTKTVEDLRAKKADPRDGCTYWNPKT